EAHNQMAAASTFDCKLNVQANQDFIDLFVQEMLTSVDVYAWGCYSHFFFQGFPTTLSQRRGYTVPTLRGFIKVFSGYW
ncbi:hypothetical protein, partial [Anaerobiospirillum succiniciproducens]|uniref:hypothetical protein n=1 Tax=Anaerobiospirillum succiniciproducens TaxID=13335 RepID=UPI003F8C6667